MPKRGSLRARVRSAGASAYRRGLPRRGHRRRRRQPGARRAPLSDLRRSRGVPEPLSFRAGRVPGRAGRRRRGATDATSPRRQPALRVPGHTRHGADSLAQQRVSLRRSCGPLDFASPPLRLPCSSSAPAPSPVARSRSGRDPTRGNSRPRIDLSHARPASYETHGSVQQIWLTGAAPGEQLQLVDRNDRLVTTAPADAQGSLIFRDVDRGRGYRVAGNGTVGTPVDVLRADEPPASSFYASQQIGPGYGYLQTRDGTLLAMNVTLPGPPENGPYPTVIEYSGYSPANPQSAQPSTLISRAFGYATVGVNIRGTGCSGGAFHVLRDAPIDRRLRRHRDDRRAAVGRARQGRNGRSLVSRHLAAVHRRDAAAASRRDRAALGDRRHRARHAAAGRHPQRRLRAVVGARIAPGTPKPRPRAVRAGPAIASAAATRCARATRSCAARPPTCCSRSPTTRTGTSSPRHSRPELFVDRIEVPVFLAGAWQDEQTGAYFANMLDDFTGTDKAWFSVTNGGHTELARSRHPQPVDRVPADLRRAGGAETAAACECDRGRSSVRKCGNRRSRCRPIASPTRRRSRPRERPSKPTRACASCSRTAREANPASRTRGSRAASRAGRYRVPRRAPGTSTTGSALVDRAPRTDAADVYTYDPSRAQSTTLPGNRHRLDLAAVAAVEVDVAARRQRRRVRDRAARRPTR